MLKQLLRPGRLFDLSGAELTQPCQGSLRIKPTGQDGKHPEGNDRTISSNES